MEDAKAREKLPLYQTIPAARPEELTPANGLPKRDVYRTWHRSHGDNGGTRFSALDQINRANVTNLQVAWTYHSRDGSNFIQCNPIIANGGMFGPTAGQHIVAVNAETGVELWRFKPEGKPAWRGLMYWPGRGGASERVLFPSGKHLYALNPRTGQTLAGFGVGGRTELPGNAQGDFGAATAGPATFENIVVVPGFEKDVWGLDVVTGKHLWTFHTVPQPGEFGYDTWDRTEPYGANCWAGMAMDETRGIAYITTDGPKPNFIGVSHLGDNLFANCVVALDARTGKYLWHFQEIRHDLWDLDISAPPNLGTITRGGKRVDSRELQRSEWGEVLGLLEQDTATNLDSLLGDLDELLADAPKQPAKNLPTKEETNPFSALFSLGELFRSNDDNSPSTGPSEPLKPDTEVERVLRSIALLEAREVCGELYLRAKPHLDPGFAQHGA